MDFFLSMVEITKRIGRNNYQKVISLHVLAKQPFRKSCLLTMFSVVSFFTHRQTCSVDCPKSRLYLSNLLLLSGVHLPNWSVTMLDMNSLIIFQKHLPVYSLILVLRIFLILLKYNPIRNTVEPTIEYHKLIWNWNWFV